ncbi:MAG: phosphatidylserine decarboxylase family protein [Phycisphaerae bacterium]|nr:phosphatidylserine decarboxylase family protein [Phycisphaerae bacterium]
MITKHGLREVGILTMALLGLCAVGALLGATVCWAFGFISLLALVVWGWVLWFFRDPTRQTPTGDGLFISPADGVVADITPLGAESILGENGVQIGIFMNVFNVHVNRVPCDGVIEDVTHRAGAFLDVRDSHASERNESATIRMTHTHNGRQYPVVFRQIAGLVARRIVTAVDKGQTVTRGSRMGMIKFGSRLELLLPQELAGEICVSISDHVRAGETILAKCKKCKQEEPSDG